MPHEFTHEGYVISDDPARLDVDAIQAYLTRSYWAEGIQREAVKRSLQHSLAIGVYTTSGKQVGLARVVTDYATFAWLCDVYILEEHRGKGLSKAAMRAVVSHPRLQDLRRIRLGTRDAHSLYEQFGFETLAEPQNQMERKNRESPPH